MNHWSSKFIDLRFKPFGCAEFVEKVLLEQFGFSYDFPKSTGSLRDDPVIIRSFCSSKLEKTENPKDGDIALMGGGRESCHVGVVTKIKDKIYILHSERKLRSSILTQVSRLSDIGYFLEGYYTWQK